MNAGGNNVTVKDNQGLNLWSICWANSHCSQCGHSRSAADDLTGSGSLTD